MAHRRRFISKLMSLLAWAMMLAVILTILLRSKGSRGEHRPM
jgi:hypothetical protein